MIESIACTNRVRSIDPGQKSVLAFCALFLSLVLSSSPVHLVAIVWIVALVIFWAGIPAKKFLMLLGAEAAFLVLTVIAVAIYPRPLTENLTGWVIGPFSITTEGILQSVELFTRSLSCIAALNFLILTTPVTDFVYLGQRLKISPIMVDLMILIYRFIFTLFDTITTMRTAQESRLGYASLKSSFASSGSLACMLFLVSYRRSCRMELALQSRCFNGSFFIGPNMYRPTVQGYLFTLLLSVSLLFTAWLFG